MANPTTDLSGAKSPEPQKKPVPEAATPNNTGVKEKGGEREAYPFGIVGAKLETVERNVGKDEPPAWGTNEKLAVVGKPTPRVDGRAKVTGAAKYTADVKLPGMLYARMITSSEPHATIKSIDTSVAEKARGVKAVHLLVKDGEKVRFVGQPIGAIAAATQADADDAARLVKIKYDTMDFVTSVDRAREPEAPLIYKENVQQKGSAGGGGAASGVEQKGNVRGPSKDVRGDVEKGLKEADAVIEAKYSTQVQTHCPLETHGLVVDYKPGEVTVYASTQGTGSVRNEIAEVFGLKQSQVRVITEYMGGGFGAKFGAQPWGVLAAHLSKKAKAPVRLMIDRREEHLAAGNRPSSNQQVKIGAKKDGTLTAIQFINYGTGGVGGGAGATGPARGMYKCDNVLTEDYDVFINAGPAAAFRAPGHPQGVFSLEQAIDELAEKLNMDPLALRDKIDAHDARREERRIGADKINWSARKPANSDAGPVKRGVGVAQALWFRGHDRNSQCDVRISKDGSVEVLSAVQDIGGGIRTALAQCVAEELGLKASDVITKIGDTHYPPGASSGGSMTTNSMTPVARNAAFHAKEKLLEQVAPALNAKAEEIAFADGKVFVKSDPNRSLSFKAACAKLNSDAITGHANRGEDYDAAVGGGRRRGSGGAGGVQFVQVAVDTETGKIKVEKVVAVHDCGRPINPLTLESQINGGVIQGISYALYENRILDRQTGIQVNANLEQYKILGTMDCPEIETVILEQYWGKSSSDAGPIGEPATIPTSAAIANAVYNAIGVRIREIPMTPAVVLKALADQKKVAST
ncbi:MAG TPA: xanthine dehydrogenase family protein molybdopterin-binding subunit [Tepidisphaeraceae bacterium]|jgi:xanthine dehydrogenase YagR molybdenum-binding subunit